jgi:adenine deaminase
MVMPNVPVHLIPAARGIEPADIVYRNARVFNAFACDWERSDLAVKNGIIIGIGTAYQSEQERDLEGAYIIPGLIDAHVHIESSLLTPLEYARLVALHGTTTVIADPHEIANVSGAAGLEFMLSCRKNASVDILYMLPSCVPATPMDVGGATLGVTDLGIFTGRDGILGLGEMMNVPGVLAGDPDVMEKLALAPIRDGHAPLLSSRDLNAYILSGLQSDHECTTRVEAEEKLRRGMYIYIREGSTEQNIAELIPLVSPANVSRCCFATDDCHADLLEGDGHIDRCIRKAVACGCVPELAIRMATLSAAERFGLPDRGALAPGRRADFCIVDNPEDFIIREVVRSEFPNGTANVRSSRQILVPAPASTFHCTTPTVKEIRIVGDGLARVIGLVPRQIITESLRFETTETGIPDTMRDILKIVVCNRYHDHRIGVGLVHGFGFKEGAIASSVSHDAHHIVAVGTSDAEIRAAISAVIRSQGGMVVMKGTRETILPLHCAGLMSTLPYQEVVIRLSTLDEHTRMLGGIDNPFMYLSFLALTVVPSLRITDRGMFDCSVFRDVPLFE